MNILHRIAMAALAVSLLAAPAASQSAEMGAKPGENAALRYWSAFAEMQDMGLTDAQAKELYRIVEGTAPFVPSTYKELIARNRPALETMARGTALPYCDWGIDYTLGADASLDHVPKAVQLGRLNVLYAMQLEMKDRAAAVKTLAAGVRFSHDVASGGTLLSALVAKSLLMAHLRVMASMLQKKDLTASERATLRNALARIGPDGLDWQASMKRELAPLRGPLPTSEGVKTLDPESQAALTRIGNLYVSALSNPSALPELQKAIANAPKPLREVVPNLTRVVREKQELTQELALVRAKLR
ncbi:MAG TPA: hypothetical protein VFJ52_10025 [Terriglobia bacterium]|nr:hypothetical protein [Terriglobia bacterium]